MRNIVGKRVKEARILAKPKITQEQLSIRLQVQDWTINRVGIAKIEAGIREVTDVEVVKLSKALGVTTSWLLGEKK
jgi:HTH-type transcriptional regulator, cell division transcriptional repressor